MVFLADVLFIMCCVPESLPVKARQAHQDQISWGNADPLFTLRVVGEDPTVLRLAIVVFLSYLPEAGQFSCFFVYLKLVYIGFILMRILALIFR